ncbi:DUF6125 family protein [Chloroflexota bacterium]
MADYRDYSGDFNPNIKYEDFSKELLAKLMTEFARCYIVAGEWWYEAVTEKFGPDAAYDIYSDMWINKLPMFEVARTVKYLNMKGNDVADLMKFYQLAPSFPKVMFDYDIDLKNRNHALMTVTHCPGLLLYESREPDKMVSICQVMELASATAYAKSINPDIVVTMPKVPPRQSPDDVCCQFEFKLEPKKT